MIIEYLEILTSQYNQMICISEEIEKIIKSHNIINGFVTIQSMHTTTGIMVNERLDCLEDDIDDFLKELVLEDKSYYHARMLDDYGSTAGNPTGHIKSMIVGNHTHLFIKDNEIIKGGAQEIYLMEFDGPSKRNIIVQIIEQ